MTQKVVWVGGVVGICEFGARLDQLQGHLMPGSQGATGEVVTATDP